MLNSESQSMKVNSVKSQVKNLPGSPSFLINSYDRFKENQELIQHDHAGRWCSKEKHDEREGKELIKWSKKELKKFKKRYAKEIHETNFRLFEKRLCANVPEELKNWVRVCKDCKVPVELVKKTGKPYVRRMVCLSPFCDDIVCYDSKELVAKAYFRLFFNAQKQWTTKKGNKWVHFSFGFIRSTLPSHSDILNQRRAVMRFLRAWKKQQGFLKGVGTRDLGYNIEKVNHEFYVHYHFACRPLKGVAFGHKDKLSPWLKKMNELAKGFGFKFNYHRPDKKEGQKQQLFHKARWLINYFSMRCAGKFGHVQHKNNFVHSDVMTARQYHKTFHKTVKVIGVGFSVKELRLLKKRAEEKLKELLEVKGEGEALISSKVELIDFLEKCPKCGNSDFCLKPIGEIDESFTHDPPIREKIPVFA